MICYGPNWIVPIRPDKSQTNTNESQLDKRKEQEKKNENSRSNSTTPSCNELMLTPAFSAIGPGYLAVDWTGWSISELQQVGARRRKKVRTPPSQQAAALLVDARLLGAYSLESRSGKAPVESQRQLCVPSSPPTFNDNPLDTTSLYLSLRPLARINRRHKI